MVEKRSENPAGDAAAGGGGARNPGFRTGVEPQKVRIHAPLYELTRARFLEFAREPGAIFWTFGFPLLLTLALGIAFRTQAPPKATIGVVDGPASERVKEVLEKTAPVEVELVSPEDGEAKLHAGKLTLVMTPGQTTTYRFDPTRPEAQVVKLQVDAAYQRAAGRSDPLPTEDEKVDAPGSRYIDWLVPGLLGMQLMSGSLWGISFTIVQTRQRKLLKRLLATPMRKRDYLLAFLISRLAFLLAEVPILLGFAYVAFGVAIRGSLVGVALMAVLGALAFAGIGLLCASRAENTETANGLVNLVTLPMFVVSGVFFSSARFPPFVQPVIRFLPLTALNEGLRGLVNDGASIVGLASQVAILCGWAIVSFAVALRIFRWNQ